MEMGKRRNSSQGKACWEAPGKIVITINKRPKKKIRPFIAFFSGEDAIGGVAAANLQLGGRDKPESKTEELERKNEQIWGQR